MRLGHWAGWRLSRWVFHVKISSGNDQPFSPVVGLEPAPYISEALHLVMLCTSCCVQERKCIGIPFVDTAIFACFAAYRRDEANVKACV
jgi:hypothetical protein